MSASNILGNAGISARKPIAQGTVKLPKAVDMPTVRPMTTRMTTPAPSYYTGDPTVGSGSSFYTGDPTMGVTHSGNITFGESRITPSIADTTKTDTTETPKPDVNMAYEDAAKRAADFYQSQISDIQSTYETNLAALDESNKRRLEQQNQYLDTKYAPEYGRVDEALKQAEQAQSFSGAASGSLWGNRQATQMQNLKDKAEQSKQAVDSAKNAELALYKAQLEGQSENVIKLYTAQLQTARQNAATAQNNLLLAQAGATEEQQKQAGELQTKQLEQLVKYYESQGKAYNPVTGDIADNPKQAAEIAKLLGEAGKASTNIEYKTDESGNVTALVYDYTSGEFQTINLGKAGAAEKWASTVGTGGGGSRIGGGSGLTAIYGMINSANTPEEARQIAIDLGYKGDKASKLLQDALDYALSQPESPTESTVPSAFQEDVKKYLPLLGKLPGMETLTDVYNYFQPKQ